MEIFWHGFSSIRIEVKHADTKATLVTDPYVNDTGLRFTKTLEPDLVLLSQADRKRFALDAFANTPFVISTPGEYEIAGIFVRGVDGASGKDAGRISYRIDVEDVSIGFLGAMKSAPSNEEVEALGDLDILVVPVGGGSVFDAAAAKDVIETIEPRIVIPTYYDVPGVEETLASVDAFCKVFGSKPESVNKLKISRKDLPEENMIIALLERA